jgi:hypothetical protein
MQSRGEITNENPEFAVGHHRASGTILDVILHAGAPAAAGASALLLTVLFGLYILWLWKYAQARDHASGTWCALAYDFSHGMLYRPLYGEQFGSGGTRYFPLHFVGTRVSLNRWNGS